MVGTPAVPAIGDVQHAFVIDAEVAGVFPAAQLDRDFALPPAHADTALRASIDRNARVFVCSDGATGRELSHAAISVSLQTLVFAPATCLAESFDGVEGGVRPDNSSQRQAPEGR
jgi:hypothetical protein